MPENVNLFPEELRRALTCLEDESRQTIASALMTETECAYTELLEKLNMSKGNLNHHLSELIKAGIIMNYSREKFGSPYESFYAIADFGKDFISGVFNALKPTELPVITSGSWHEVGTASTGVIRDQDFSQLTEEKDQVIDAGGKFTLIGLNLPVQLGQQSVAVTPVPQIRKRR